MDLKGYITGKVVYEDGMNKTIYTVRLDSGEYTTFSCENDEPESFNFHDKVVLTVSKQEE